MPRRLLLPRLALALTLAMPSAAAAQGLPIDPPLQVPGVTYDPAIPAPEQVIGHRIGTRHTRPDQLVTYLRAVDALSDRVTVAQHGTTYEGRPLVHAIITSPANHARLDAIQAANRRLTDAPEAVGDADLAGMPVVVYLEYSVHGNEASGSEASLLTLYHLAAGRGPAVDSILERAVVILDPSLNPDGRARFVDWVNGQRGPVASLDPQDREHNEPWPNGRTNHYWFDLNRDWLPAQHPESRARLALYHAWRPQLLTDFHEMGSDQSFFFQPGVPSRTNPNTPAAVQALAAELATYHGRRLDALGSLYYTRQGYDDFYYGKGSTYPDINGAVGILFEQASSRALARPTTSGELRYGFTVRNQLSASLSTLEGAVAMRGKFLRHQRDFYREAMGARGPAGWVVALEPDRSRARALLEALGRHGIRAHALTRAVTLDGRTWRPGEAVVLPGRQPQRRLLQATMERVTQFQDSIFYDISAWSFPLAFGVPAAELRQDAAPLAGAEVTAAELDAGEVVGGPAGYAYVLTWDRYLAPRALHRLQQAGIIPWLATEPFEVMSAGERRRLPRGSVVVPVTGRDPSAPSAGEVHALVRRVAAEERVRFLAVDAGLALAGPDLGAASSVALRPRVVALVAGDGMPAAETGEVWHLLAERMGLPVSLLDASRLGRLDLSRYTTLVLAGALPGGRDAAARGALDAWVKAGGTLVTLAGATRWAIEAGLAEEQVRKLPADSARRGFADAREWQAAQELSGAILEAVADTTHPLAYGLGARVPVFLTDTLLLEPSRAPGGTVLALGPQPRLSGYVPARAQGVLPGSAVLSARRSGRGRVILFALNPAFRAFWLGTTGLLTNAVFLADAL